VDAIRALGENKFKVLIFTVGEHEHSAETLKGIPKDVEIHMYKKGGPRRGNVLSTESSSGLCVAKKDSGIAMISDWRVGECYEAGG
jgi:hypothetical protein